MDRDYEIVQNAFLLDSINEWTPLKSPLNIHSSIRKVAGMQRYNLGYSFAREVLNNNILSPLGLVVNARGGTKIDQWVLGHTISMKPSEEVNPPLVKERSLPPFGFRGKVTSVIKIQVIKATSKNLNQSYTA